MRKLFIASLITAAAFSVGLAQETRPTPSTEEILKQGHAPSQPGGIGRAVVIVTDNDGNPVRNAYVKLESVWGGDHVCDSWNWTNDKGVLALNPIHMGTLKMTVKAKGYQTQKVIVDATSLGDPVKVTLPRKT
jgi:hypothetical protein